MSIGAEVSSSSWRRLAPIYLVGQGVLGVAWWVLLLTSPTVRSWFELVSDRRGALDSFLVADVVVFIGGSFVSAWAVATRWWWETVAAAATAGGLAYATLLLASWVIFEGSPPLGLVPMAVATGMTAAIAVKTAAGEDQ